MYDEEEPSTPVGGNSSGNVHNYPQEDLHFDQIVNEISDIQQKVDMLLFGSVFLRKPQGLPEGASVPEKPNEVPNLAEIKLTIDETIGHMQTLNERLKELLDNKDNEIYEDQIDEYLRELEDSERTLNALKPMLNPEKLREGETGKTDVSWLSWRKNTLGTKLHKESNDLLALIEGNDNNDESGRKFFEGTQKSYSCWLLPPTHWIHLCERSLNGFLKAEKSTKSRLKAAEALLKTAVNLQRSAQYLSWFTRKVLDYNETLDEFQRDFTCQLVAQWVQEEVNKVNEHHKNCMNFCSELSRKGET